MPVDAATLADRYQNASGETQALVDRLLEQDADDRAWTAQLGPVLRQTDVARLLGKSKQAVSADAGLLKLELRSGEIGYPVFQFDGQRTLPGLRQAVKLLAPAVATTWTTASWLTSPQPDLDERRPVDLLRDGQVDAVLAAARRTARAMRR